MSARPAGHASLDDDACVICSALNEEPSGQDEYTRFLRQAWPLLLCGAAFQEFNPRNLESWVRLWGLLGAALFNCFWRGDQFVRTDMIVRAREQGGLHGNMVARQLERFINRSGRD